MIRSRSTTEPIGCPIQRLLLSLSGDSFPTPRSPPYQQTLGRLGCPIQALLLGLSGRFGNGLKALPGISFPTPRCLPYDRPAQASFERGTRRFYWNEDGEPETFSPNRLPLEEGIDTRKTRVPHSSPSFGLEWEVREGTESLTRDFLPDSQISTVRTDPLKLRLNGAPIVSNWNEDGEPETFSPNRLPLEEEDTRKTRVPHSSPSFGLEWEVWEWTESLTRDFLPDSQMSTVPTDPLKLRLNGAPVVFIGMRTVNQKRSHRIDFP